MSRCCGLIERDATQLSAMLVCNRCRHRHCNKIIKSDSDDIVSRGEFLSDGNWVLISLSFVKFVSDGSGHKSI